MKHQILAPLLVTCAVALSAPAQQPETSYFPLKPGTIWHYRSGDKATPLRLARLEQVNDAVCAVLETKRGDGLPIVEHVAVKGDGVYRYKAFGILLDPPLCFLKLPPAKGTTWKVDSKIGADSVAGTATLDEELDVKVPFGTYKTVKVTMTLERAKHKVIITSYFARGIGMIKQVQNVNGKESVLALENFLEGK